MAKQGTAHKRQVCPVCGEVIEPGENLLSHPKLNRWVHSACAKENLEGGENMTESKTSGGNLQGIVDQLKPEQRGALAPPPTEEETKQRSVQQNQATLTRTLQIIIETLPYVHPDWLLSSVGEISEELRDIARLYFVRDAISSIDRVIRLQDLLIAYSEKLLRDDNVEIPSTSREDEFKLDTILRELADRIGSPQTGRR